MSARAVVLVCASVLALMLLVTLRNRQLLPAGLLTNGAAVPPGPGQAKLTVIRGRESPSASSKDLETLMHSVTQLRAEPFDSETLQELEQNLYAFPLPRERLQAAALLNRYGRSKGTEHLRSALRDSPRSADGTLAALALTMSRDKEAKSLIRANLAAYISNPEFAEAVARWPDPDLIDATRLLLSDPSLAPFAAKILARVGAPQSDRPVLALHLTRAMDSARGPALLTFEAALVRIGEQAADGFLRRVHDYVDRPMPVEGLVKEMLALAGPEQNKPIMDQIFAQYIERRNLNAALYRKHEEAVRSGDGKSHPLPGYPVAEELLLREAVAVAVEENAPSHVPQIYRSLEAAQGAIYLPLLNRELIAALSILDPEKCRATLLEMGFAEREIDAGIALSKLPKVPSLLRPRQMELALSRRVAPDPAR